jgi:enamine deaminase RidA (YjgF/YER057c/UK114 family)
MVPARATFAVSDLPLGALVEIDCTAVQYMSRATSCAFPWM